MIVRALLSIGFAVAFISTPAAWADSICGVKYKSPSQIEKVLRNKGLSPNRSDTLYVAYMERPSPTMILAWAFTKAGTPSHPAVVCRKITEKSKTLTMTMYVRCGGPKAACDRLVADFKQLNANMTKALNRTN